MRRTVAFLVVLCLMLAGAAPAGAAWKSPPHEPPPPGGKLGIVQANPQATPAGPAAPNVGPGRRGLAVPANSGAGRRAVYSNSMQHVWLVEADGSVARDYDVSGRRGVPKPGTYKVYSRSRVSSSGSLTLNYMVRFARGSRLAIGFHEIPRRPNGTYIQSHAELGQPRSAGCIRQAPVDAAFMWNWGQVGTPVVVLP